MVDRFFLFVDETMNRNYPIDAMTVLDGTAIVNSFLYQN
jgi:hypothetical protein